MKRLTYLTELKSDLTAEIGCKHGSFNMTIWAASWQNQQSDGAPSENSDKPGHPVISVFAVRSVGS